ncbi:MAG: peptidase T [Lachnospiraceae bacterium]|jgi:tripeptide aminopeptidase|nr:peptidase T [Lachnospiraceae bacterium]
MSESSVTKRFLRYIALDTQSEEEKEQIPSTEKQRTLAGLLAEELKAMGAVDVTVSPQSYVYGVIPATTEKKLPAVGFIAHMDTSPDASGSGVKARIVTGYDGGDICLNEKQNLVLSPKDFSSLRHYIGQDLIVTDGTTLLGADDKAGVAEIMTMAEYFLTHKEIPHGKICIGFTPDEEVGRGADGFDVKFFGADVAYTVDGGALGELEYENFNAASGKVVIHGRGVHPGSAKNVMKNAALIAMEFHQMLPAAQNPMYTEGYEGFFHLTDIKGDVVETRMNYIIRDHDRERFEEKKVLFTHIGEFLNKKYEKGTMEITVRDSYYNMQEKVEPHFYLIDIAKASMEKLGILPKVVPIRGGTDGARLSYMGLPCPNLCTGGENFHGIHEYVCVQSMEKVVNLLTEIVKEFARDPVEK